MSDKEFNIKSSTIEKGLELAKDFVGKLIGPTIEELGLFVSDNIKYLRFKNQVKILLKAKKYVEDNKISIKEVPIKILVPLLEKASLEESEELQDKWASMLANMVNSEKNFQNQIFPSILSQLSIEEFNELNELLNAEKDFRGMVAKYNRVRREYNLSTVKQIEELKEKISDLERTGMYLNLEEFECANLVRLGLIKKVPPSIYIPEFRTGGHYDSGEQWHALNAEYDADNNGYRLTELGEKFLEMCQLKTA
ncbi:Abi-alpha family protein [Filimonas effusa]|uniref:DUF4393 domain-containing protein n=1 Tax=Filimonas effusa TaxID=2508721 RepID=A0A4Q1D0J7_9BACT|nr:Abi-alpha family protein [Filimonas effusa]RXK81264.1 DUF4393 domain-containing protein [Filimonas effusa]